ncbi:hypothetical protein Acsp03_04700 [Actinomadura sp. NBRC 104412]|uniref:TY-Chap domain-containing protein n=1 Tax=Actinomadura sp. NBRC 104412 TaxID=3032203 RepID=UPI0024A0D233|nr:hypothetical protein [Actinomadura sp. NBRC 104412]GLZ03003.1 hypothetical protein Acsp03_04700 [Actinomadura sp. NBRC 104412]
MTWEEFASGLAEELAGLPAGALLVVSEPDERGRYAQFSQGDAELVAYVVVNSWLPEPARATREGERAIARAGWNEPLPPGHENWWRTLSWPASSRQYRDLADSVVTALRDGYGIAGPDGWTYQAWNERTGDDLELPRLGLAPASNEETPAEETRT